MFLGSDRTVPVGKHSAGTNAALSFFIAPYGTCLVLMPLARTADVIPTWDTLLIKIEAHGNVGSDMPGEASPNRLSSIAFPLPALVLLDVHQGSSELQRLPTRH